MADSALGGSWQGFVLCYFLWLRESCPRLTFFPTPLQYPFT